ncbi:hypothetical protein C8J56DRAFT_794152, partial [Mycena floridula]
CLTGHGFIGEYYSKFVPSENTDCTACGDRFQTREHILKDCPEYEWDRDILRDVSKDIALPTIMGTKKGILALAEFIEKSGAFTKTGKPRKDRDMPTLEEEPDPVERDEPEEDEEDEDEEARGEG